MRYLSLFSGIEAATVAWHPLGWTPVAFAQFDPEHDYSKGPDFPSAVLAHHYPDVPNLGDVTRIDELDVLTLGPIDVVVGGSPCFTAGHLVLTSTGLVPIEQVTVGMHVWTHRGRWRAVTATMTRTAPTVVLKGQGHNAMRATPDHPFYAADTEREWNGNRYTRSVGAPRWVRAEDMKGLRWATPVALKRPAGCAPPEVLATEEGAYLAGLYVGDGTLARRSDRNCMAVLLSVSDMAHTQSTRRLQLSRDAVARALLGSFREHSHSKTIPVWAFDMPEAWRRAFFRGVLDTDGSAIRSGWRVTTVSRHLAVGLRLLAAGLGYSTSLHFSKRPETHVIQGRTVNQRDTWTVAWREGNRASELRDGGFAWGLVRSVDAAEEATVYDITVEEDHSFICDGIALHNCQDLSVAGTRAGLAGERSSLFHEQVRIFRAARKHCGARYLLWENVPGAFSSNKGRDFGSVVEAMAGLPDGSLAVPPKGWGHEGFAVGPEGMVEWAVLDAQFFGVAQRRVRLFALLDTGDWTRRQPILPQPARYRGDPPARGAQGQDAAAGAGAGAADCGGPDGGRAGGVTAFGGNNTAGPIEVAAALNANRGCHNPGDFEAGTLLAVSDDPVHAICANEQRTYTNEGTVFQLRNVVAQPLPFDQNQITHPENRSQPKPGDPAPPLVRYGVPPTIAFNPQEMTHGDATQAGPVEALRALRHAVGEEAFCVWSLGILAALRSEEVLRKALHGSGLRHAAFTRSWLVHCALAREKSDPRWLLQSLRETECAGCTPPGWQPAEQLVEQLGTYLSELSQPGAQAERFMRDLQRAAEGAELLREALSAVQEVGRSARSEAQPAHAALAVRRLTVTECEFLQGFPRGYTLIPFRGKPAADGNRYKALGNSMAVPVMRWIGEQIDLAWLVEG